MASSADLGQPQPTAEDQGQPTPGSEARNETGQGPEAQHQINSTPGSSSQGDREMRNEMNALKAQMAEVMRVLLSLKNGNDFNAAIWSPYGLPMGCPPSSNPEANPGFGPVATIESGQPTAVGSEGATGESRIPTPCPLVIPAESPQNFTPQPSAVPQAQGFTSGNPAYSQVQHAVPVMAPVFQPHQAMGSFPQVYSGEHQQTKEQFRMLEERLRIIESSDSRAREARDPPQSIPAPSPIQPVRPPQNTNQNNYQKNHQEKRHTTFDPIPLSYTDLFNYLYTNKLINTRPMRPVQPPFFRGYNPNSTCAFHEGAAGHVVEDCKAFRRVVQDMIDSKSITFRQENPSITANPLQGHGRPTTNAIMKGPSLIRVVEDIRTPLRVIHGDICRCGIIRMGCVQKGVCVAANCSGACEGFKTALQDVMDRQKAQIGTQKKEEDVQTFDNSRSSQGLIEVPYGQKLVGEENPLSAPRMSKTDAMVAKVMMGNGYQMGKGLGKSEQGILVPVQLQEYRDRRGLGYWPTRTKRKRMAEEKCEEKLAKPQGRESSLMEIPICDLKQSFRSAGLLDPDQVTVVEEEIAESKSVDLVRRSAEGEELGNWKSIDFPVVFISK